MRFIEIDLPPLTVPVVKLLLAAPLGQPLTHLSGSELRAVVGADVVGYTVAYKQVTQPLQCLLDPQPPRYIDWLRRADGLDEQLFLESLQESTRRGATFCGCEHELPFTKVSGNLSPIYCQDSSGGEP